MILTNGNTFVLWSQNLRVGQEKKFCIGFTQENSIKNSVQDCLPYILVLMVRAIYCAPCPKVPWVLHEANMCCPCCMTVLVPSTSFSQVSWSVLWLRHQFVTDVTVWLINPNLSCSKNRKWKRKENKENKIKWKGKIK